jgi:hypothetical protein
VVLPVLSAPSFRADKNYPEIGLRMRVLGGSVPEPLSTHKTYTYTFTRDGESFKQDRFDAQELWYATQNVGQWRDSAENVMIIGRASRLLPRIEMDTKHVPRDAFETAMADPATEFDPENNASLTAWVTDFSGCTLLQPENLRTGFNLTHALFFPVEEASTLIYAFRAKTRLPSGKTMPSEWFCVVVKINDGTPKSKTRKDFETQFLANVAALPRSSLPVTTTGTSNKLPVPASTSSATANIPEHPSRTAARKSIANMKGWWYAETPEYIFLSDIRSAAGKALVRDLQKNMPVLRSAFMRLIPPFTDNTDVSVVRIYQEPDAYKQYVGESHEWSVGLWSPMQRELVILAQDREREQIMHVITHESFHQYLFYACNMIPNAVWYNEGHACFFETAQVGSRGRVRITENSRVSHLGRNLDAAAALLPKLLQYDYNGFYNGSKDQRALNYTTAWALIYFLRQGVHEEKLEAYAGILDAYLRSLASAKDAAAATEAAFENIDMPRFQKAFVNFWRRRINSVRSFDIATE